MTMPTKIDRHHMLVLQIRQRLKLEINTSMKASSGPAATTLARKRLGLHGNPKSLLEQVEAMWENILAVRKYTGSGLYNCCKNFSPPKWADYDGFEIQPLMWLQEHNCMETILDKESIHLMQFWTVYGHLYAGGVECITDCNTRKQAISIVNLFIKEHGEGIATAGAVRELQGAKIH